MYVQSFANLLPVVFALRKDYRYHTFGLDRLKQPSAPLDLVRSWHIHSN
jgi:hypothetical protein